MGIAEATSLMFVSISRVFVRDTIVARSLDLWINALLALVGLPGFSGYLFSPVQGATLVSIKIQIFDCQWNVYIF